MGNMFQNVTQKSRTPKKTASLSLIETLFKINQWYFDVSRSPSNGRRILQAKKINKNQQNQVTLTNF